MAAGPWQRDRGRDGDLPAGDLAALLMGSCGLAALLRLGAASADDAEKARQLAQLLYCVQKPWLNADY